MKGIDELEGEVSTDGLPDDIVERLERRVAENRFLDPGHRYRIVDAEPRAATAYRTADVPRRTLHASTGLFPMHVELEADGPRVRYAVRSPARRALPLALQFGAFAALISLFAIASSSASGFETLSIALGLSFLVLSLAAFKARSVFRKSMNIEPSLSQMLREESTMHARVDAAPHVRVAEEREEEEPSEHSTAARAQSSKS